MAGSQSEPVGRLIYKTSLSLRNYAENLLKPYDLTVEQLFLLKNTTLDEGITQKQLSDIVGKQPANITRILDRLERKSLIRRVPNPDDRRSALVLLTIQGQDLLSEVKSLFESYSGRMLQGISPEEEQMFKEILARIESNIQFLTENILKKEKR